MYIEKVDENSLIEFASNWVKTISAPATIYLEGDLGAGKTTYARAAIRKIGFKGTVPSPTYTLLEEYQTINPSVYHFDLYRLDSPKELEMLGARDAFSKIGLFFIEWPEKGHPYIPPPNYSILITHAGALRNLKIVNHEI